MFRESQILAKKLKGSQRRFKNFQRISQTFREAHIISGNVQRLSGNITDFQRNSMSFKECSKIVRDYHRLSEKLRESQGRSKSLLRISETSGVKQAQRVIVAWGTRSKEEVVPPSFPLRGRCTSDAIYDCGCCGKGGSKRCFLSERARAFVFRWF